MNTFIKTNVYVSETHYPAAALCLVAEERKMQEG